MSDDRNSMTSMRRLVKQISCLAVGALALLGGAGRSMAETNEVKVASQFGLAYLSIMVINDQKLFEDELKKAGLPDTKATFVTFPSGAVMNDAVLSGAAHFAVSGIPAFVTLWDKALGTRNEVRAAAAVLSEPLVLNTRDPNIKSIKDYTEKNKIALGAVKVSIQAVTLQMAAAEAFGIKEFDKLDKLTTTLSQGDGMVALLSNSGIDSHFTSAPYHLLELEKPGIRSILNSYDIVGKNHTSVLLWSGAKFHDENPKTYKAFMAAYNRANSLIKENPKKAAEIYLRISKENTTSEFIERILKSPDFDFTSRPKHVQKYLDFMTKSGTLKREAKWPDLFFPEARTGDGS